MHPFSLSGMDEELKSQADALHHSLYEYGRNARSLMCCCQALPSWTVGGDLLPRASSRNTPEQACKACILQGTLCLVHSAVSSIPVQVLLTVRAVGLNFRDVLNVMGMYPGRDPGEPGGDVAGIVADVGVNLRTVYQ